MKQVRPYSVRAALLVPVALLGISVIGCEGEDQPASASCRYSIECKTTITDSRACILRSAGRCAPDQDGNKKCWYPPDHAIPDCWCVEGDTKVCTTEGKTWGRQVCTKFNTSTGVGAKFGPCEELPPEP